MHNRIFSTKSIILNTSEHRSTIKALLVGTLQQELQVTSRQILGGLPQSLAVATLRLNLLFVPGSPACIKRWRFLARFLSSFAASRTCRFKSERRWRRSAISWCSKAWPAHEYARCQKCWYHVQVHIETTCFCCKSELTHSVTLSRTVLSRGKGMLVSETLPTCCVRRPRFPARKTQLKSSTLTRSSQVANLHSI